MPNPTTPKPEKPAEFPTEDHRDGHLVALIRERDGYLAKAAGCESRNDDGGAQLYRGRADQVDDELTRLGDSAAKRRGATRGTTSSTPPLPPAA